jgi:hypothetical protein
MGRSTEVENYNRYHRMVLSQVSLKSFCINQSRSEDNGPSVFHWDVEGPEIGYKLYLNDKCILSKGKTAIRPLYDTVYHLVARAGNLTKTLATARVNVNLEAWNPLEHHARRNILPLIVRYIENDRVLYFKNRSKIPFSLKNTSTKIHVSPDKISIALRLKSKLKYVPDPTIRISTTFGINLEGNNLTAKDPNIGVKINLPFYLRPFISEKEADRIKSDAEQSINRLISAIVSMLNSITPFRSGIREITAPNANNERLSKLVSSAYPQRGKTRSVKAMMSKSA